MTSIHRSHADNALDGARVCPQNPGLMFTTTTAFSIDETRRVLAGTPDVLRALLTALPDRLLAINEGDGTWSAMQVLAHLAWGERDDWVPRIRLTLDKGDAEPYRPFDREAGFAMYAGWPVGRLLDEFAELRKASLHTFDSLGVRPEDLSRKGRHPDLGSVTVEQLLATWVTSDCAHIVQIARVQAKHHGQFAGPWRRYFSLFR
jgi:hypothetical protein